MIALSTLLALGCAATFAVSTSVQHHAAASAPSSTRGIVALLGYLVRRPAWLLGQLLAVVAFSLHAGALHTGPIAVVQPIVVSGIVWAVPVRAAISRRLPSVAEIRAVLLTASGLAVFLVASNPSRGTDADLGWQSGLLVGAGLLLALASNAAADRMRRRDPRRQAFFLGVTGGVLFGMVAVLLKMSLQALDSGGLLAVASSWPPYALLLCGAGGVLTNQRAYRVAALSASMPVLNIVNGLTALGFGFTIFAEIPRHSPLLVLVEAVALVTIAVGLLLLVRLEEGYLASSTSSPEGAEA